MLESKVALFSPWRSNAELGRVEFSVLVGEEERKAGTAELMLDATKDGAVSAAGRADANALRAIAAELLRAADYLETGTVTAPSR